MCGSEAAGAGARELEPPDVEAQLGQARSFGRVTLRLRLTVDTLDLWRSFERSFTKNRTALSPERLSLLRFLCVSFWRSWGWTVKSDSASTHVFARDGFECTSPVCSRTDVQDHHLIFALTAAATSSRTGPPCVGGATSTACTKAASSPYRPHRAFRGASVEWARFASTDVGSSRRLSLDL